MATRSAHQETKWAARPLALLRVHVDRRTSQTHHRRSMETAAQPSMHWHRPSMGVTQRQPKTCVYGQLSIIRYIYRYTWYIALPVTADRITEVQHQQHASTLVPCRQPVLCSSHTRRRPMAGREVVPPAAPPPTKRPGRRARSPERKHHAESKEHRDRITTTPCPARSDSDRARWPASAASGEGSSSAHPMPPVTQPGHARPSAALTLSPRLSI